MPLQPARKLATGLNTYLVAQLTGSPRPPVIANLAVGADDPLTTVDTPRGLRKNRLLFIADSGNVIDMTRSAWGPSNFTGGFPGEISFNQSLEIRR